MNTNDLIYVTGANGLVGSAIIRKLKEQGFTNVYPITRKHCDLSNTLAPVKLRQCFGDAKYIFHTAAMVGGIGKNIKYPAEMGLENSRINNNVIEWSYRNKSKLLFLGSSCIYPRECLQPMKEEYLMSGPCEPTNEMYALSKIYGIKLCQAYRKQYGSNFISCQPSNIYGEGDHFDPENAHVVGSLIHRFHTAKIEGSPTLTLWGKGTARRELMYVDDAADACVFLMKNYNDSELINIGVSKDYTISEIANAIKNVVGYDGEILWDDTKPEGMPRKIVDSSKINALGWKHKIEFQEGLEKTYKYYLKEFK